MFLKYIVKLLSYHLEFYIILYHFELSISIPFDI